MRLQRGNAFFITLICVVLLGAVTFVVARQMSGSAAITITPERTELFATQALNYIATAQMVAQQMAETGVPIQSIDWTLPSAGTFNNPPTNTKIFHPAGGGLRSWPTIPAEFSPTANANWNVANTVNIEWTPTTAADTFMVMRRISAPLCAALNKKITGSEAVPNGGALPPTAASCPGCVGQPVLCYYRTDNSQYTLYAIIGAR